MKLLRIILCFLFIASTFILCGANVYVDVCDEIDIKIDGKYIEEDWQNAYFVNNDMPDTQTTQDKYNVMGFLLDESNLYIVVFVMDNATFELNSESDGVKFTITENNESRNFFIQANGVYSGSKCDYFIDKDEQSYTVEIKIPFTEKINAESNLKIDGKVIDNCINGENVECAETDITTLHMNLNFENIEETTITQKQTTTQIKTIKETTTKKSEKTTTKKVNTTANKTTTQNITSEIINNINTTTTEKSEVIFKENSTAQTLIFYEQSGSNNNITKIIGIAVASVLILVGVILIMKFKN